MASAREGRRDHPRPPQEISHLLGAHRRQQLKPWQRPGAGSRRHGPDDETVCPWAPLSNERPRPHQHVSSLAETDLAGEQHQLSGRVDGDRTRSMTTGFGTRSHRL